MTQDRGEKIFYVQVNYYYLVPVTEGDEEYDPDVPLSKWEFDNENSERKDCSFHNEYYSFEEEPMSTAVDDLIYLLNNPFGQIGILVETGAWRFYVREDKEFPPGGNVHLYTEMVDLKHGNEYAVDLEGEFGGGWELDEIEQVWEKMTNKKVLAPPSPESFQPTDDEKRMVELEQMFEKFISEFPRYSTDYAVIAVHLGVHEEFFALRERLEK
jgi:hypothetical protein